MMAASHIVVATSSYAALALLAQDLPLNVWQLCLAGFGALVPDLDHRQSTLGARSRLISPLVAALCGHRGATHSLLAAFLVAGLAGGVMLYAAIPLTGLAAFACGYLSHLAADWSTARGVPLFWPLKKRFRAPWAFPTGGLREFLAATGFALFLAWRLDWLGRILEYLGQVLGHSGPAS